MTSTAPPTASPSAPPADGAALTVTAWRDHDPALCETDALRLGAVEVTGGSADAARQLWDLGARRVALPGLLDLTDTSQSAHTVRALCLVGELTARAVRVEWRLRLGPGTPSARSLGHLQPPAELLGTDDDTEQLRRWRSDHYLGKCLWRRGPGFVQIRDRRFGELRRFTVDEPEHQEAIELLGGGTRDTAVDAAALADLEGEDLVGRIGDRVWLLPYRVRRWTQTGMVI